jgi:anti-sigma factor RsiW
MNIENNDFHDTEDHALNEELVAYLDGELNRDSVSRVEDELSKNSEYRLRLMQLQQAWDLMDELPRVSSDEAFTKSTVELVVVSAESEETATVVGRKTWRNVIWVIGLLGATAAAWGGFALISQFNDRDNQALLKDLPLVQEIDIYDPIESLDFLKQLEASGVFDEELDDAI